MTDARSEPGMHDNGESGTTKGGSGITLEADRNTATLHFQPWEGTNKQDPEKWLKK